LLEDEFADQTDGIMPPQVLLHSGGQGQPSVLLLSNAQLKEEAFLEDVINMLNTVGCGAGPVAALPAGGSTVHVQLEPFPAADNPLLCGPEGKPGSAAAAGRA
jgi:hypothetical protein